MYRSQSLLAGATLVLTLSACAQGTPGAAQSSTPAAQETAFPVTTTELPRGGGGSAHVRSAWMVDGANVSIEYGRPALKGRAESQMMPPGRPWRTGADVATILTTDRALSFGAFTLQPGSYTINTQPGDQWQIIFGTLKTPTQWGVPYQPALELGRAAMQRTTAAPPVELVTFHIDRTSSGPSLRIEWGTTSASTPFVVGRS